MAPVSRRLATAASPCVTSPSNIPITSPRRPSRSVYCDHGQLCTLDETADEVRNVVLDVKYGVEAPSEEDPETDALELDTDTETESPGDSGSWEADPRGNAESIETEYDAGEELKNLVDDLYEELRADDLLMDSKHDTEVCMTLLSSEEMRNGCISREDNSIFVPAQDPSSAQQSLDRRSSIDSGYLSAIDNTCADNKYKILHFLVQRKANATTDSICHSCNPELQNKGSHDGEETESCPCFGGLLYHLTTDQREEVYRNGSSVLDTMVCPDSKSQAPYLSVDFQKSKGPLKSNCKEAAPVRSNGPPIGILLAFNEVLFSRSSSDPTPNLDKIDPQVISTPLIAFQSRADQLLTPPVTACLSPAEYIRPHTRGIAIRLPPKIMSKPKREENERAWMFSLRGDESPTESGPEIQEEVNRVPKKRKRGPGNGGNGGGKKGR